MTAYWWVPCALVMYAAIAILSRLNAEHRGMWTLWVMLAGWIPLWAIISRYSKNLLFDGMLFDVVMFFGYAVTLLVLGAGRQFTCSQWAGTGCVVVGFILMRVRI
jgi:hypothetical protein